MAAYIQAHFTAGRPGIELMGPRETVIHLQGLHLSGWKLCRVVTRAPSIVWSTLQSGPDLWDAGSGCYFCFRAMWRETLALTSVTLPEGVTRPVEISIF